MDILVKASVLTGKSTISICSIDGVFECYICEDVVREIPGRPVAEWKVPGQTAIPAGRYKVARTWSPRFQKIYPLLVGVPGFDGIRIHPGNKAEDTEGCLLPGEHKGPDSVSDSRNAFYKLDHKIAEAIADGEDVWITIDRGPE